MKSYAAPGARIPRAARRLSVAIATAGAISASAAAAAHATSLVYVQGGNVFIANADGSNAHQVTTDGSPSSGATNDNNAYRDPTISDGGTILADRGGEFYFMSENGTTSSVREPSTRAYPLESAISPDGTKVAYNYSYVTQCVTYDYYNCGYYPSPGASVEGVDGSGQEGTGPRANEDLHWLDSQSVLVNTDTSYLDFDTYNGAYGDWFTPDTYFPGPTDYPHEATVSRAGDLLVVVMRPSSGKPSASDYLTFWKMNGAPAKNSDTPTYMCSITAADAGGFQKPSLAPDDSAVVWTDAAGVQELPLDASFKSACEPGPGDPLSLTDDTPLVAGASDASFGEAANNPLPKPVTPPSGGGSGGTPGGSGTGSPTGGTTTTPAGTSTTTRTTTTPAPAPVVLKATLTTHPRSISAATLIATGVRFALDCSTPCHYTLAIVLANRTARTLGLTKRKHASVRIGTLKGSATKKTLTVHLSRTAARALAHHHGPVTATVLLSAKAGTGRAVTHSYPLSIRG